MKISDLNAYGANVEEGLRRCLNNEEFYLRLVRKAAADGSFQKLYEAMAAGEISAAFDAAHTLKGSMGNLALTPIYLPAAELTEILRKGKAEGCDGLVEAIRKAQIELAAICERE